MGFVKVEQKEGYAILTIDREKALNALNSEVLGDLDAAIDALDLDAVRAPDYHRRRQQELCRRRGTSAR